MALTQRIASIVRRGHETSKNGTFLPWREDVPPYFPHRGEVVPFLRVLTRVQQLEAVVAGACV